MLRFFYTIATTWAAPILRAHLRHRAARGKEIAARLCEREGIDPTPRPPGRLLWLHAASVGEAVSVLPILGVLPANVTVLLTTGTVTSATLLEARLPQLGLSDRVLHRFVPLDVPAWAARFLDHWRPDAAGFVESEIWPNLLLACQQRGIATMLVNARLSPASYARWRRLPGLARLIFGGYALVQPQSSGDAHRLIALGARNMLAAGNLKFAAEPLPADGAALAQVQAALAGRPVWLAASTHPGEEKLIAAVHARLADTRPDLVTIIVPRHPDRGAELADELGAPRRGAGELPPRPGGIWLVDTMGELGLLFRCSKVVFVGKSALTPGGGQNPLEPARLGCAVAVGPHTGNFVEACQVLHAAGALRIVADADALFGFVAEMLDAPDVCAAMGQAGRVAAAGAAELPGQIAAALCGLVGR